MPEAQDREALKERVKRLFNYFRSVSQRLELWYKTPAGEGPRPLNDYQWFKETYGLKSRFIETIIAYYGYGNPR